MKQLVASRSHQIVRVAAFKETTRSDESVLYQQIVIGSAQGTYDLSFSLRDDAGGKGSSIEATVNVPRIACWIAVVADPGL